MPAAPRSAGASDLIHACNYTLQEKGDSYPIENVSYVERLD
jgi:hypothetical protein